MGQWHCVMDQLVRTWYMVLITTLPPRHQGIESGCNQ